MSRTYRCRKLSNTHIKKVVDGAGRIWRRRRKEIEQKALKLMGLKEVPPYSVFLMKHNGKKLTHTVYVPPVMSKEPIYVFKGKPIYWTKVPAHYETQPGGWVKNKLYVEFYALVDKLDKETPVEVSAWHPDQKKPSIGRRKKNVRIKLNRKSRHKTKANLKSFDPDSDILPNERMNWWDVY